MSPRRRCRARRRRRRRWRCARRGSGTRRTSRRRGSRRSPAGSGWRARGRGRAAGPRAAGAAAAPRRAGAARRASACWIASAARSAASCSRSRSSAVKLRGTRLPTCRTPRTRPSTSRGTPSSDRMPFSRRIGLRMSAWSTSSIAIARRSAAMRPANPVPTGISTPCSTSSSIPFAARARSSVAAVVEQQDRRGVRAQDRADAVQQLAQQLLLWEVGERRVRHPLKRLERREPGPRRRAVARSKSSACSIASAARSAASWSRSASPR